VYLEGKVILWVDTGDISCFKNKHCEGETLLQMDKYTVYVYSRVTYSCTNKNSFVYTKISVMFRPNLWSKGWPKHVAVCSVYKLISIYVSKCVGSIILDIQLTHESCIIQMKLLLYSKHSSSPSQQKDSIDIKGSDRLSL